MARAPRGGGGGGGRGVGGGAVGCVPVVAATPTTCELCAPTPGACAPPPLPCAPTAAPLGARGPCAPLALDSAAVGAHGGDGC
eukprot:3156921-Prymnesium_polylepis.1